MSVDFQPATPQPSLADLTQEIVDTHHAYVRKGLADLTHLVTLVARVHGGSHAELAQVKDTYTAAITILEPHLTTAERDVFPAIGRLEQTRASESSLTQPIAQLRAEHQAVGQLFATLRELTSDYAVPADACEAYQGMLGGLVAMEQNLQDLTNKENNVLFPRALELEAQLTKA